MCPKLAQTEGKDLHSMDIKTRYAYLEPEFVYKFSNLISGWIFLYSVCEIALLPPTFFLFPDQEGK